MIEVRRKEGQSFDQMFKVFKSKYNRSGLKKELMDRKYFEKRSDKRRRLENAAKRKSKRTPY